MEIIDNINVFGGVCSVWTSQINGDHYIFFTNKTNEDIMIRMDTENGNSYLGTLDGNMSISTFCVGIHGVDFKKNFDIIIWKKIFMDGIHRKDYDPNSALNKTIIWN